MAEEIQRQQVQWQRRMLTNQVPAAALCKSLCGEKRLALLFVEVAEKASLASLGEVCKAGVR